MQHRNYDNIIDSLRSTVLSLSFRLLSPNVRFDYQETFSLEFERSLSMHQMNRSWHACNMHEFINKPIERNALLIFMRK